MPFSAAMLLALAASSPGRILLPDLPDETAVHLGIALKLGDTQGLQQLLADQQDPTSPSYHAWLDPETFGERFGLSAEDYDEIVQWFSARGFTVTRYPNRSFFEAVGRVDTVRASLGVQIRGAMERGRQFRTFDGKVSLPESFASKVLHISGLDTRPRLRHHINVSGGGQALGPDDIRLEYDLTSFTSGGQAAAGLTTAVLGTQEGTTTSRECNDYSPGSAPFIPPSTQAIQAYFSLSNATATYNPIVVSNPGDDFDTCGSNQEYQLDVEMQSVGAPNAADIDLVLSPSSEVFTTGTEYIVNSVSNAVVVSTSLGLCESEEEQGSGGGPTTSGSEMQVMEQTVQQGEAEGQTWFAAAGDDGADDCNDNDSGTGNGYGGGNATVDFPGSMPEIVDMGGTQFGGTPDWNSSGALVAFVSEVAWNEGQQGGAGGGGQSLYYSKPSYQQGIGPEASDGARDVPDLALTAATGTPGVAVYDCGSGQDETCQGETSGTGTLDVFGGTSIASPLAAGIFALLSGQVGCRLGDVHSIVYQLGQAQQNGGPQVFHDITSGNNDFVDPENRTIDGFSAGPGFDLVTGWGSIDVGALVANWPGCGGTTTTTTGATTSGTIGSSGTTSGSTSSAAATGTTSGSAVAATGTTSGRVSSTTTSSGASTSGSSHSTSGASSTGGTLAGGTGTSTTTSGGPAPGGCSCGSREGESLVLWLPLAWIGLAARRRRR